MKLKKTIYLCGFMGCGKSTLGFHASKKLSLPIVDVDYIVEKKEKRSISEIFASKGEEHFRNAETRVIRSLSFQPPRVVSLGGGAVLREKNVKLMKRRGIVVLIDTPFDVIYERVKRNDRRPLAKSLDYDGLYELYEKRRDAYLSAADVILTPKDNIEETYDEFIRILEENRAIEKSNR